MAVRETVFDCPEAAVPASIRGEDDDNLTATLSVITTCHLSPILRSAAVMVNGKDVRPFHMSSRLFLWSVVSALAGLLFGFDTVVISGAEKTIQALWGLSPAMHGLAMGAALWGTVLGLLVGSWPTDTFGRKKKLLCIGLLFLAGSLWSAFASEVYGFMVARFIGGIAIGVSTVAAPLYISEISPPESRGRLAGMFQFNIVFGILVAFLSNYLLAKIGDNSWRWMLGIMAVPSLLYTPGLLHHPREPALAALAQRRPGGRADGAETYLAKRLRRADRSQRENDDRLGPRIRRLDARLLAQWDAHTHPHRVPRGVLQSTLRHQRDPVFCAAHF